MNEIKRTELFDITGGGISGSLISAIGDILETILDIGRSIGSAIYRLINQNTCS